MAAIANVSVYDGLATPALHTLYAIELERQKNILRAVWRANVSGVPLEAQERLFLTREILRSGMHRYEARIESPVMESVSGQNAAGYTAAPKVAYVDTAGFYVLSHPRSQLAGKRNVRQMMLNFSRGVSVTATPETTGVAIDAFESGILPT